MADEELKQCPFCGEDIKASAIKCKHCGEFLNHQSQNEKDENELYNELCEAYYGTPQKTTVKNDTDCGLKTVWKTIVANITIIIVLALLPVIGEIFMLLMLESGGW